MKGSSPCMERHIVKHGLDWICKIWTGFVKHGFLKHGFVKHGFVKHGFVRKSKDRPTRTPDVVFVVASHYQRLQIIVLLLQACRLEIYLFCKI